LLLTIAAKEAEQKGYTPRWSPPSSRPLARRRLARDQLHLARCRPAPRL
jgi:hypothetical protein